MQLEIWQEIRKDRECGAKRLVMEYGDRAFAAAALLCRNDSDAEELVFRAFEQAIRKIGTFRPTGDFFSWLYAIMLNFGRMDLRKRRVEMVPSGDWGDLSSRRTVSSNARRPLRRAHGPQGAGVHLPAPARSRRAPLLRGGIRRLDGRRLNVSEGTIKSRLYNAREILCELLSKQK